MRRLRFEKAYCVELGKIINPYLARELYFDENSEYYNKKLTFRCCELSCNGCLTPVGIYRSRRSKIALHFRKKGVHTCEDDKVKEVLGYEEKDVSDPEGFKVTRYPSELVLTKNKAKNTGAIGVELDDEEGEGYLVRSIQKDEEINKLSKFKTTSFEHIVDCFINGKDNILKSIDLTIGGKTKKFKYFFKKIQYYEDEKDLIYYGKIETIKRYGKNYKIIFKDRKFKTRKAISIYITDELINTYSRKKMFRDQIEGLIENREKEILCFFVDAYPKEVKFEADNKEVTLIQVDINNLHNIVFTFD